MLGIHCGHIRPQSQPMSRHDTPPTLPRRHTDVDASQCAAGLAASLLKGLTPAFLEVARGDHVASRCLKRQTWNHKCKSKLCEVQDCEHYHHGLHSDSRRGMRAAHDSEERPYVTATENVTTPPRSVQQGTENRLHKDQTPKQKYSEQIKLLIIDGYAELASRTSGGCKWYLPHCSSN